MSEKRKSGKKKGHDPLDVGEYSSHLHDEDDIKNLRAKLGKFARFRIWFIETVEFLHDRGRERLTVMLIPHTEKKSLTLHVSLYTITAMAAIIVIILVVSVFNLVGKSGQEIQFYDMGLSNSQFNQQSIKMAEEMIPLHDMISEYTGTIADMYLKLDGKPEVVLGQGGIAQSISDTEIKALKELVKQCKELENDCGQNLTENILHRVISISEQDNFNLQRSVEVSEKILKELGTPEKKNLLKNTPSIWPVNGYLISPYGMVVDPFEGREKFSRGISIGALPGTEIYSTAPGNVLDILYDTSRGLQIRIQHKYGIQTYYAHLSRVRVQKGDKVQKGSVIGYVGKTGLTPVNMLYYEVHVGTVAYNPHAFLNHLRDQWLIQPRT